MSNDLSVFAYSSQLIILWHLDNTSDLPKQFVVRLNGEQLQSPILCVPLKPSAADEPAMLLVKQIKAAPPSAKVTIESASGQMLASSRKSTLRSLVEKDLRNFSESVRTRIWVGLTSLYAKALGDQSARQQFEIVNAIAVEHPDNFSRTDGLAYARIDHAWRGPTIRAKAAVTLHSSKQIRDLAAADVLLDGNTVHAIFNIGNRLIRDEAVCLLSLENGLRLPVRIDLSKKTKELPEGLKAAAQQPALAALLMNAGLIK